MLDKDIKDNIINRVKALIIHKISAAVTNGTDNILISIFLGISTVGLYTNYNYIFSAVKKLFSNIVSSIVPSIGNLLIENNFDKNYLVFKKVKFFNYWITVFTSVCLLLLIEPFIKLWIGDSFLLNRFVLFALVFNYFQSMMRIVYGSFKDAGGIWIEDKYVPLLQLSINLISSIVLVKLIGLAGIFIGTILSSFVVWFYSYPKFVYKKLFDKSIYFYFKDLLIHFVLFIFILFVSYFINSFSSNIFISFIISLFVPNLILFIIYRNREEFKYFINLIKVF